MKTFYQIKDVDGKSIINNFPQELQYLLTVDRQKSEKIDIFLKSKSVRAKIGLQRNENGEIITMTTEERYVNSSSLFNELSQMGLLTLDNVIAFRKDISLNQNEYVQDLVHNLTSLNTYNVQELESLISPKVLTKNINTQKETIKNIVIEKPNITANTLLKLIKYNYAMKVEFSVFEKTIMKNPTVQKLEYSVREAILSILQIFIEDFEDKKIIVSVETDEKRIYIDYEILFVSLFYIFENAVKYCCFNSKFKIIFKQEQNKYAVIFDMLSLRIEDHEIPFICQKKFRAKSAILLSSNGQGIGMSRVLKTLKLNNAELEIKPRVSDYSRVKNDFSYDHNQLILKFDSNRLI